MNIPAWQREKEARDAKRETGGYLPPEGGVWTAEERKAIEPILSESFDYVGDLRAAHVTVDALVRALEDAIRPYNSHAEILVMEKNVNALLVAVKS